MSNAERILWYALLPAVIVVAVVTAYVIAKVFSE